MSPIVKFSSTTVATLGCFMMAVTLATAIPVQPSTTLPTTSALTTTSPMVSTTPIPSAVTANQSMYAGLVNSLLLQPLVDFNNQLAQAVNTIPERFAQNGESLGSALAQPIKYGAETSNQLASQLNDTIVSVSNAVHPILIRPLAWMVNSTFGEMALNALNYSSTQLGSKINSVGESIASTGEGVSSAGNSIVTFVQALDQTLRQLNSTITQTELTTEVTSEATLLTTPIDDASTTFETTTLLPEVATTESADDLASFQVNTVSPLISN